MKTIVIREVKEIEVEKGNFTNGIVVYNDKKQFIGIVINDNNGDYAIVTINGDTLKDKFNTLKELMINFQFYEFKQL